MDLPFALPDWLPAWAFLLLAIPALLFLLAFLVMPFSVFGVKARLEAVEAQLEAVQEELHNLNLRAAGISGGALATSDSFDTLPSFARVKSARAEAGHAEPRTAPPPPPPAALSPIVPREHATGPRLPHRPQRRTEPKLD